jgi:hypothetical protein
MTDFAFFPISVPETMQCDDHAEHRTQTGPGNSIGPWSACLPPTAAHAAMSG